MIKLDSRRGRLKRGCTMHRNLMKFQPDGAFNNNLVTFISFFSIESSRIKHTCKHFGS